jgi:serine protease Do
MNRRLVWLGLAMASAMVGLAVDAPRPDPEVGKSYRVPYRMTETNHFLVRVRIDGKGPFNFLVDTGAPHLFVGAEAAKKVGIVADPEEYFTPIGRLDFEGGATLTGMKARVEDIFQMVGMNALGLPGASIDGILGFSGLARFKIELDPTDDRMTWTRLDYEPKEPFVPRAALKKMQANQPAEMRAMNALGPIAKFAAAMLGKQPEDELHPRGFLGIELLEDSGHLRVSGLLADSPALAKGLKTGDRLSKVKGKEITTLKGAREAVAEVRPGDEVPVVVDRDGKTLEFTLTAGEGL